MLDISLLIVPLEPRLVMGNSHGQGSRVPQNSMADLDTVKTKNYNDAIRIYNSLSESCRWDVKQYLSTGILSSVRVMEENVMDMLSLCECVTGLEELRGMCELQLIDNKNTQNMIEMYKVAERFLLHDLKERAIQEVNNNLQYLCQMPEYLNLTCQQIIEIMNHPLVQQNRIAPEVLYYWYVRNIEVRRNTYNDLLSSLHRSSNDSHNLEPSNNNNNGTRHYLASFTTNRNEKNVNHPRAMLLELTSGRTHNLSIRKGENIGSHFAVCCQQRNVTEAPYVYLTGSENPRHAQQVLQCDVVMDRWKMCAHMKHGRSKHRMETINDHVYVIGGVSGGKTVPQIEEYDRKKNRWKDVAQLQWDVHSCISAVYDDKIYLFGGKNVNNDDVSVIQSFDPKKRSVDVIGYLPYECSGGQAIVFENKIFIATEQGHLMDFRPTENITHVCAQQPMRRKYFSMVLKNSHLLIINGVLESDIESNNTCKYCLVTKTWTVENGSKRSNSVAIVGQCLIKTPMDVKHIPLVG